MRFFFDARETERVRFFSIFVYVPPRGLPGAWKQTDPDKNFDS